MTLSAADIRRLAVAVADELEARARSGRTSLVGFGALVQRCVTIKTPPGVLSSDGGYVYFVQCDEPRQSIKIGASNDIERRLLQSGFEFSFGHWRSL